GVGEAGGSRGGRVDGGVLLLVSGCLALIILLPISGREPQLRPLPIRAAISLLQCLEQRWSPKPSRPGMRSNLAADVPVGAIDMIDHAVGSFGNRGLGFRSRPTREARQAN